MGWQCYGEHSVVSLVNEFLSLRAVLRRRGRRGAYLISDVTPHNNMIVHVACCSATVETHERDIHQTVTFMHSVRSELIVVWSAPSRVCVSVCQSARPIVSRYVSSLLPAERCN